MFHLQKALHPLWIQCRPSFHTTTLADHVFPFESWIVIFGGNLRSLSFITSAGMYYRKHIGCIWYAHIMKHITILSKLTTSHDQHLDLVKLDSQLKIFIFLLSFFLMYLFCLSFVIFGYHCCTSLSSCCVGVSSPGIGMTMGALSSHVCVYIYYSFILKVQIYGCKVFETPSFSLYILPLKLYIICYNFFTN